MKQLNFFRKFMPSLIVYQLYLMVNETSYMIVKTFTRLYIYRSSSPSKKGGRGKGAPSPLRVSICPKNKVGPGSRQFSVCSNLSQTPPRSTGVQIFPATILLRTIFDALKTGVLRAGHTNNKCLHTVITN